MEDKRLAAIGPNPSGLCMCGCGRKTKIVTKSDRRHLHVMGQPFRFIHGHRRPAAKGPNGFKLRRQTAVIFLERRDGTVLECLVSRQDFHRVRRHHWYVNKNGKRASYAVAWIDGAQVQMHKHLCPNWPQVNHPNGNGLDNRRENLRGVRKPPDRWVLRTSLLHELGSVSRQSRANERFHSLLSNVLPGPRRRCDFADN